MLLRDKSFLKAVWAGMFILCGVLGFLPDQQGATLALMVALAVAFFAAPGYLTWLSWRQGDARELKLVRNLSAISLGSTLVLIMANLFSTLGPTWLGDVLYYALTVVSTPMMCGHTWALSLTLWAALLWSSIIALRELKKR